jgi:hypothetical protein
MTDTLNYPFVNEGLNLNTVRRYFSIFSKITLSYYKLKMENMMLEGDIEIDEFYLFKEKSHQLPIVHIN